MEWASDFANQNSNLHPPPRLCLTDTHPGNFLVDASGKVLFVDLEKALYASPAIDLGHPTILTSTLWETDLVCKFKELESLVSGSPRSIQINTILHNFTPN